MKRIVCLFWAFALLLTLAACGGSPGREGPAPAPGSGASSLAAPQASPASQPEPSAPPEEEAPEPGGDGRRILIAYFSATHNTQSIANHLNELLDADLYEIVPETPYTSDDLDYSDPESRSSREMDDPDARPAISGGVEDMGQYEVIFLGYPIWWGEAPRILCTFLESYDFADKTIISFCTSGSSPLGSSAANLQELAGGAVWLEGRRFGGGASFEDVQTWVDGLELNG